MRRGIRGMRTLLVDIYPPNLETSGLLPALEDHVSSLGGRDINVLMDLARESGAELYVASAPGAGTRWLLRGPARSH